MPSKLLLHALCITVLQRKGSATNKQSYLPHFTPIIFLQKGLPGTTSNTLYHIYLPHFYMLYTYLFINTFSLFFFTYLLFCIHLFTYVFISWLAYLHPIKNRSSMKAEGFVCYAHCSISYIYHSAWHTISIPIYL